MMDMPLCYCCTHLRSTVNDSKLKCDAFPRGIPTKFTLGDDYGDRPLHITPEDGDKDIQFELGGNLIMSTKDALTVYNEIFLPAMQQGG